MRSAKERCKRLALLRGAYDKGKRDVQIKKRRRACEARTIQMFLIWTSKLLKLRPKTGQDSHESTTERLTRSTWSPRWPKMRQDRPKRAPRWSQDGQVGANMEPRWPQDSPKRLPKEDQNHRKSLLEAIWRPQEKQKEKMQ